MSVVSPRKARRIDHVVMPVASLERTRTWFEQLGFLVAPEAVHPFGTENACVFFADGSFLEPLAIASRETCEAEARSGNIFVARDQAHRFRTGEPSFSGLAFASVDAGSDLAAFRAAGIGEGEPYAFSRPFTRVDGSAGEVGFRLAFAADRRAPDISLFVCEPTHAASADRTPLITHPNTALGLARVVLSEPNPTDFQYLLQELANRREIAADSFGMTVQVDGGEIEVLTPNGLQARYGSPAGAERGLRLTGNVVAVADIAAPLAFAQGAGIPCEERMGRLVVRLDPGLSSFIAFEERLSA